MSQLANQTLIFDADDTLWENNIYFEEAFERFVTFLDHEHLSASEIQAIVDEMELDTRTTHGYGARAFAHSLRRTFRHITGLDDDHPDVEEAEKLGLQVLDAPFDLLPHVATTLSALQPGHTMLMLTKGHQTEQQLKIDRSGLSHFFEVVIITPEKSTETYRHLVLAQDLDPADVWMIGNSPRSDINPALAAGLNAVFIPHPRTWHLEVEELGTQPASGRQLLELSSIVQLTQHFRQKPTSDS